MFGFLSRIHHYKCCVLTSVDVFPNYVYVLVSVWSALFVPESNHVTYLMHHHVMILTTGSNRYFPAFILRSAHCTVTTGIRKVQRKETWHLSAYAVQRPKILRNAIPGINCRVEDCRGTNYAIHWILNYIGGWRYPSVDITRRSIRIKTSRSRVENKQKTEIQIWESNPGHIAGRRALSPLRHPCSPR